MSSTNTATRLRVAVFGVGAVGGVFGARLARAGHDVWFIARGATRDALEAGGLKVDSVEGNIHLQSVHVTDDPSEVGFVDVVLVGVKATQVSGVAASMRALIGKTTMVIPLQNGVEASSQLAAVLGPDHIMEGLCRVVAEQTAPGHIRHMALTPILEFGVRAGATASIVAAGIPAVAAAISAAGIRVKIQEDMAVASWEKFLFIEPMGAVGAATRKPFGVVRSIPETRALVDAVLDELMAVGRSAGVNWPEDAKAGVWKLYDGMPPTEFTSMARDLIAGRPSEFDAQTAAVVRLARQYTVSTPVHDVLYAILLPSAVAAH